MECASCAASVSRPRQLSSALCATCTEDLRKRCPACGAAIAEGDGDVARSSFRTWHLPCLFAFRPDHKLVGVRNLLSTASAASIRDAEEEGFVKAVSGVLRQVAFDAGQPVLPKGPTDCMYFVAAGEVEEMLFGDPRAAYGPGEHVGELGLLLSIPLAESVRAKTRCTLLGLERGDLDALAEAFPRVVQQLKSWAERHSRKLQQQSRQPVAAPTSSGASSDTERAEASEQSGAAAAAYAASSSSASTSSGRYGTHRSLSFVQGSRLTE